MYLIDKEIRAILNELEIEASYPGFEFSADDQIQPCSIDIRLSNIFWMPVARKPYWNPFGQRQTVDLRKSKLAEMSPRKHWRSLTLDPNECLTIKPGQMLLGRTYERFTVPPNIAGQIIGRSSFARMGLSVHCSSGFINPGWQGHMPLQRVNNGPHIIKVFPFYQFAN